MPERTERTLLEKLNDVVEIDCDTMDSEFVASLPFKPHDCTCNPRWLHFYMTDAASTDLVRGIVKQHKGKRWDEIYCHIAAGLQAQILPYITGRVLAQVSPSHSYDTDYMVWQGETYAAAWQAAGIPKDRFCVKLPLTGPGVAAAKILQSKGIPTLGTSLFNIYQAIAAAQAGQYAVSMYFNEPRAWFESGSWVDVPNPESDHPMAARHARMRVIFEYLRASGKKAPQIKTASCISARECLALYELGTERLTLNRATMEDLLASGSLPVWKKGLWKVPVSKQLTEPGFAWDAPWSPASRETVNSFMTKIAAVDTLTPTDSPQWLEEALKVDYTAPGVLDAINESDAATKVRLEYALEYFASQELLSKEFIQSLLVEI